MEFEKGFDFNFKTKELYAHHFEDEIGYLVIKSKDIQSCFDEIFDKLVKDDRFKDYNIDTLDYYITFYDGYDGMSASMIVCQVETKAERLDRYEKWLKNKDKREEQKQKAKAKKAEQARLKQIEQEQKDREVAELERKQRYEEFLKLKKEFGE